MAAPQSDLYGQKVLEEFIKLDRNAAIAYALEHAPDIFTQANYSVMERLINQTVSQPDAHTYLLDRKKLLSQIAAHSLIYTQNGWPTRRQYLLNGLAWVADPTAEEYFKSLMETNDEDKGIIQYYSNLVNWCTREGVEKVVNETDIEWLVAQSRRAQGEAKISFLEKALSLCTNPHTEQWAKLELLLGHALLEITSTKRAEYVEAAIAAYQLALQVYTLEQFPVDWAMTQMNLGSAYQDRIRGERVQNLEQAIEAYQLALQVYTPEQFPVDWATTQNNLGNAYADRIRGERAQNLEQAIKAYQLALQVYTPEQFPQACRDTCFNLGNLLYSEKRWREARQACQGAHQALELLRSETLREESRRRIAQDNALLYANLIHCCLLEEDWEGAATYALSGKSRSLAELLAGDSRSLDKLLRQDPQLAQEWQPVQALKAELGTLQALVMRPPVESDQRSSEELANEKTSQQKRLSVLRQQINRHTDELLFRYPALSAVQALPPFSVQEAQELSGALGQIPLVEYIGHGGGWGALVFNVQKVQYVALAQDVFDQLVESLNLLLNEAFWQANDWPERLKQMYALLISPLRAQLPESGAVVLAPTGALHLVPFQALMDEESKFLSDHYALTFVPSLATLRVLHQQGKRPATRTPTPRRLLSVAYAGQGEYFLPNAVPEARAVAENFEQVEPLLEEKALPELVIEAANKQPYEVLHLSCHGSFDFNSPADSGLLLAQDRVLSLNDIRVQIQLQGGPLVTLSACQTGQTRPEQGDETTGLSWAFLAAGASAVVSSQWSVPDASTRLLFEAFYRLRRQPKLSDAEALRQAMQQVRKKVAYRPLPQFWAAFQVMGLPLPQ